MKFQTIIGAIKLTRIRKMHIIQRHPIMEDYLKYLKEALETPGDIRYSSHSQDVLLFYRFFDTIENGKYISVVVRKTDGSILTAYLTNRIKGGKRYEEN